MSENSVKITVNKPAADNVFRNAPFVRFHADGSSVLVQGTQSGSGDAVAIEPRLLGGFSLLLDGSKAARLLSALSLQPDRPFFALGPTEGGWFRLHRPAASIARHVPWMRIWPRSYASETKLPIRDAETLVTAVRDAETVINGRSAGRPTVKFQAARELIDAVRSEARRMGLMDIRPIEDTVDRLLQYLEVLKGQERTTSYKISDVREAVFAAEHSDNDTVKSALVALMVAVQMAKASL